jgi:hypothetical protein
VYFCGADFICRSLNVWPQSGHTHSTPLTMTVKRKLEGKKRPELVEEQERFNYNDIKYTKNIIKV